MEPTLTEVAVTPQIVKVLDFYSVMLTGVQELVERLQEEQEELLYKMKVSGRCLGSWNHQSLPALFGIFLLLS